MKRDVLLVAVMLGCQPILTTCASSVPDNWSTLTLPDKSAQVTFPDSLGTPGTDHIIAGWLIVFPRGGANGRSIHISVSTGPVLILEGAAGGLYDPGYAPPLLEEDELARLRKALPPLTAANLCRAIASNSSLSGLDPYLKRESSATQEQLRFLDSFGHWQPEVLECHGDGNVVSFVEHVGLSPESPGSKRTYVFGTVVFLKGRYSCAQAVQRSLLPPTAEERELMRRIVLTVRASNPFQVTAPGK